MRSIALGARPQSRFLMMAVAREIKRRHGSKIHLYCNGPQERAFYESQDRDGLFASIVEADQVHRHVRDDGLDPDEVFARARRLEALIGHTINRMVVADRHLGRGYALGGVHHPRSRTSETADYIRMVHALCCSLEFWEQEFREKGVTLCLNGSREAAYIASVRGVPYRVLAGSRIRNLHYWAWNEMYETPVFEEAWRALDYTPENDLKAPYFTHQVNRRLFRRRYSFGAMVRRVGRHLLQYAYWWLRGYQKAKSYYLRDTIGLAYRVWRDHGRLARLATHRLKDLDGKRFVYFPLHIEPEMALHGISPEYFYQHAAIAAVSRDLPAGVYLAVKEAFGAIGRRPDTLYRQIADLKNVVLLDTWELGFDCAQRADAVVTICGTAALEALVAGKPVIAFGHHNIYNFLPAVQVVSDERRLADHLRAALDSKFDPNTVRSEARRLLKAIEDNSFDLGSYDYVNVERFEAAAVEAAYHSLMTTLPGRAPTAAKVSAS